MMIRSSSGALMLSRAILLSVIAFVHLPNAAGKNFDRQLYKSIKQYMNLQVNPCEDFYDFACGNWPLSHQTERYSETIGYIDYNVNAEYGLILKAAQKKHLGTQHKFVQTTLDYYESCITLDNTNALQYLEWLTEHEHIKWPKITQIRRGRRKQSEDYDWLKLLATLQKYGFNGVLIEELVSRRPDFGRAAIIDLDKPVLNGGFTKMKKKTFNILADFFDITDRHRDELWGKVHEFETSLELFDALEDEVGNEIKTIKAVNRTWIERYLSILLDKKPAPNMEISIQNIAYFDAMYDFVETLEAEFVCRYLMLRFILHYLTYAEPENFNRIECASQVRSMLPHAMHWLYEKEHPELLAETPQIETLFNELVQNFKQMLQKSANRFNDTILQLLQSKLDTMSIKVGNLPRVATEQKIAELYSNVSINTNDFRGNTLKLSNAYFKQKHATLDQLQPQGAEAFFLEDISIGASSSPYFLMNANIVIVPLTALNEPIYVVNTHRIFKFSALGFLLAHEIMHGFDFSGIAYDAQGNTHGLTEEIMSNKRFNKSLVCLQKNDPNIIDEKIADVSGLHLTYNTYFQNATKMPQEPFARWSNSWTERQLFFLNFAQFFCGNPNREISVDYNEHGSDKQRVLDALANFEQFSQDFKCSKGTAMNPVEKCQLYRRR